LSTLALGLGQPNEGQIVLLPIGCKGFGVFGAEDDNLRLSLDKFLMILAQLRHVPLAEWSGQAAVEDQHHMRFAAEIGQADGLTQEIGQAEIGSGGMDRDLRHQVHPMG
jgi:hypothetical protein